MYWLLVLTGVVVSPAVPNHVPGDVHSSAVLGAAVSKERCDFAGTVAVIQFDQTAGGAVKYHSNCIEVTENEYNVIRQAQGWGATN